MRQEDLEFDICSKENNNKKRPWHFQEDDGTGDDVKQISQAQNYKHGIFSLKNFFFSVNFRGRGDGWERR